MREQHPALDTSPLRRASLPRLTRRAFIDLGLWMLALGVAIGVSFPYVLQLVGVPATLVMKPAFFVLTVIAGIALAGTNFLLVRWVIGVRVLALSQQVAHVADVIVDASYSGDWSQCSPQRCHFPVDSEDALGEVAASFNGLVGALAASRTVQQAATDHARLLGQHLDVATLTTAALHNLIEVGGAHAGTFLVVREDGVEPTASFRLDPDALVGNATFRAALEHKRTRLLPVPADLSVDAVLVSFRPAAVLVVPLRVRDTVVGGLVLAFTESPSPQVMQQLDSLGDTTAVALQNAMTHERFQRLAAVDPLTGCYNRRFGMQRLGEEWARGLRTNAPMGVLAFDLDRFKSVNDQHGHLAGDTVLRAAAEAARGAVREQDIIIRSGGEEFLVVLPDALEQDVAHVGERIRHAIAHQAVPTPAGEIHVTVSVGGAAFPVASASSVEELVTLADDRLYLSKRAGRDRLTMSGVSSDAA